MAKRVPHSQFFDAARSVFGDIEEISRVQIIEVCEKTGVNFPNWLTNDVDRRVGRGLYSLKEAVNTIAPSVPLVPVEVPVEASIVEQKSTVNLIGTVLNSDLESLVPTKAKGYVPFGNFSDIRQIIKSGKFYPTYITGLSGNGKTMMVEQTCAVEKRECVRVRNRDCPHTVRCVVADDIVDQDGLPCRQTVRRRSNCNRASVRRVCDIPGCHTDIVDRRYRRKVAYITFSVKKAGVSVDSPTNGSACTASNCACGCWFRHTSVLESRQQTVPFLGISITVEDVDLPVG